MRSRLAQYAVAVCLCVLVYMCLASVPVQLLISLCLSFFSILSVDKYFKILLSASYIVYLYVVYDYVCTSVHLNAYLCVFLNVFLSYHL